jgi:hypothetical protein
MYRPDDSADMNIHVTKSGQFAHIFPILPEADDREPAGFVGGLRRADIEVAGTVGKLHHIIHMRRNTNVFVEPAVNLVNGDARL